MLDVLRKKNPLALCLTNHVVMNYTANCLLAAGCSPIMALDRREINELVAIADCLLVNIGSIDENFNELATVAAVSAAQKGIPIVLDPVAFGASYVRKNATMQVINNAGKNLIIKGNASEILALCGVESSGKGVDSADSELMAAKAAAQIVAKYGCVIVVTGADDYIVWQDGMIKCSNGTSLLRSVTGAGCTLGAIIAVFMSVENTPQNIANAISYFNIAAEFAERKANIPGSFGVALIDALYYISDNDVKQYIKIENL
jgi:hydroxyethylthiazole kinase